MGNISIAELAKLTGTSKATVSRVVNNCFGVDAKTREKIKAAAKEHGYVSPQTRGSEIRVILPDKPQFYWREAYRGIFSVLHARGADASTAIFSSLSETAEYAELLTDALCESPRAVITAAPKNDEIARLLCELAEKTAVFLLSEKLDIRGTFYIGEDPYKSGESLGRAVASALPSPARILHISGGTVNAPERLRGFLSAAPETFRLAGELIYPGASSTPSAEMAREIHKQGADRFNLCFCSDGVLPQACLALKKLRAEHILCAGFENPPDASKYIASGMVAAIAEQDLFTIGKTAALCALDFLENDTFPAQKHTEIAPTITRFAPEWGE